MNKIKPRAPLRPQGRLFGLRASTPASHRSPSPAMLRSPSPAVTVVAAPVKKGPAPCEQCGQTSFIEDGGQVICENCGAISIDTGNFANDVVFGETDSGRTQQVGTRVNEGQTHQRTFMARNQPLGRVGHEAMHTSEKAKLEADATFNKFTMLLGIRQKEKNAAAMIFQMAYGNGFVRGRTIESVAIVCLYLATRRAKDAVPPYSLMLIDFAEPANINVFDIGRMMQDMVKRLYLGSDGKLAENESILLRAPGAEVLIEKFVKHLDFGHDEYKIRKDATKILQRMKKDWLHDGRRPAGVCGAAVILAARMNNYRRTLREVVLCAKVTELTVNKRLEEFNMTDSSKLSVNEFRNDEVRDALEETDPPAFYRATLPSSKKKRGRPRKNPAPVTAAEIEDDQSQTDGEAGDTQEPPQKRARIDADGFAVPNLPAHVGQPTEGSPVKKRGKPKGTKNWKAPPPTAAEIAFEVEIEHEIQDALDKNQDLGGVVQSRDRDAEDPQDVTLADVVPYRHDRHPRFDPPGPPARSNEGNSGDVNMDPEIGQAEFDDDPEVNSCILNEAEKALKEKIWVTENAEWLRQENAKKVKRELKNRHLIEQGIDPEDLERQKGKVLKRKDGARRSGRVGDVEYLKDDFHKKKRHIGENRPIEVHGEAGGDTEEGDPETGQAQVAVRKMFNQRGTFSRRINYENLLGAYKPPSESTSLSPSRSPSRDREDSVVSTASSSATRRNSGIEWFHVNKPGQDPTPSSIGQRKRQAREKAEREQQRQLQQTQSGHSASGSPAVEDEAEQGNDRRRDSASNSATPDVEDQAGSTAATQQPKQLPTPRPTQPTPASSLAREGTAKLPSGEPVSDTDSPLSSTHTPQGFGTGSATNTPANASRAPSRRSASASPEPRPQSQTPTGLRITQNPNEISEDDVESDEGDYVEEEEDVDDANEDDRLDDAFAGRYQRPAAPDYDWNDEVVEDG